MPRKGEVEETDADVFTNCRHTARPCFVLTLGWLYCCTVEPPNKGHFGTSHFVLCREGVLFSEVKNVLLKWERGILCREVVPFLEGPLSEVPL